MNRYTLFYSIRDMSGFNVSVDADTQEQAIEWLKATSPAANGITVRTLGPTPKPRKGAKNA